MGSAGRDEIRKHMSDMTSFLQEQPTAGVEFCLFVLKLPKMLASYHMIIYNISEVMDYV